MYDRNMKKIELNGIWQAACVSEGKEFSFVGNVPGCVLNDLVQNRIIDVDLLTGRNADRAVSYENDDWKYERTFVCDQAARRAILQFGRLDTYADVYLNGIHLGYRENGNIQQEFDVSQVLKCGKNHLEVFLYSPVTRVAGLPPRNGCFTLERLNTRRTQCTYGWDWVARFVTCGMVGVSLRIYDEDELTVSPYIYTKGIDDDGAAIGADITISTPYKGRVLSFSISAPSGDTVWKKEMFCDMPFVRLSADIRFPQLWYPAGYGEQPLYVFSITEVGGGEICREAFGIRTIRVLQLSDEKGSENEQKCLRIQNPVYDKNTEFSGFIVKVNGLKVFCMGANWVPCQPYESKGKESRITRILETAREMGLNMLRVWGGGAFECQHFYDECSRLGILVVQDFLMACGAYPDKADWFINHLRDEADYAVRFLRNQPCLAWWNGDNENGSDGRDTDADYIGRKCVLSGIAPVVYAEDPYRNFFPSSPYGGSFYASNTVGTTHSTQLLGQLFEYIEHAEKLDDYKEEIKKYRARFIAEEVGFGAVSLPSLKKFMTDEEIFGNDLSAWLYHTKGNPGLLRELFDYFREFAEKVIGKPKNGKDRLFFYEYFQYEWMRVVFEQARREKWFCSGLLFWMLNDCWTAASGWALIDYYELPKAAYYSFKRCSKAVICSLDRDRDDISLCVSNVSAYYHKVCVRVYTLNREIVTLNIESKANENVSVVLDCDLSFGELLIADLSYATNTDRTFYRDGGLPLVDASASLEYVVEGSFVRVRAKQYIHAVKLVGEAVFEDNCFSLMVGEERCIKFRYVHNAVDKNIMCQAYTLA